MAPGGAPGVEVLPWAEDTPAPEPGEVVVEAFGCDPPAAFIARMARQATPPLWINLEYLSAEAYVRRSHGLRSPQLAGPGRGLDKWFFYPGFEPGTGGLIRETGLMAQREQFDRTSWLHQRGWAPHMGERVLSLFCYASAPVGALLASLGDLPTMLLVTPGAASQALDSALARQPAAPTLRCIPLPWLTQPDYDRLLWACDLNFVRGEDSFVRAQWAGAPFVWQAYPQHDAAHAAKLEAFANLMLQGAAPELSQAVRSLWRGWNGLQAGPLALPPAPAWQAQALSWRKQLLGQADLASQLLGFASETR
jgi:uncharacterized repeat protein (TIGR03837 family)